MVCASAILGQLWGVVEPDAITLALIAIGFMAIACVLWPAAVIAAVRRIESVEAAGVKVLLSASHAAEDTRKAFRLVDDEQPVIERRHRSSMNEEVSDIRHEIARKLRFIGVSMFGLPPEPSELAIIHGLKSKGLLDAAEALTLEAALNLNSEMLAAMDSPDRDAYLNDLWDTGVRLAAVVWDRLVRGAFETRASGSRFGSPDGDHRRDMLIVIEGRLAVVAARVSVPIESLNHTVSRWGEEVSLASEDTDSVRYSEMRHIIVHPDYVEIDPAWRYRMRVSSEHVELVSLQALAELTGRRQLIESRLNW